MANWQAIATIGRTVLGLIEDHYPSAELAAPEFRIVHPGSFEKPQKEGFSFCVYRVGISGTLRALPPRRDADGRRYRPSLPVDIQFLLTPWAEDAEKQLRLLGWTMRFLEDVGTLSAAVLNSYAAESAVFRAEEGVEVVCEALAPADHFNLWDKLKPRMQPSLTYVARMVLIDSGIEQRDAGPVQTRVLELGQAVTP